MNYRKYILVNNIPVLEPDLIKWAQWVQSANREIASVCLDNCLARLVFTGFNVSGSDHDEPILWDLVVTMPVVSSTKFSRLDEALDEFARLISNRKIHEGRQN
jgi:hypothetical protein